MQFQLNTTTICILISNFLLTGLQLNWDCGKTQPEMMMYGFVLKRRHPWGADAAKKLIGTNLALEKKNYFFFPVSKEQSNDGAFYKCF